MPFGHLLARPWGRVVDVDALLTAGRGSQQQLRRSLGRVVDRLEGREKALVHLDKRLAELASRDAAARSGRPVEAAERAKLTEARGKLCDVGSRTRSAAPKPTAKPHASHAPYTYRKLGCSAAIDYAALMSSSLTLCLHCLCAANGSCW